MTSALRLAFDLKASWQARALMHARDLMSPVVLSVLSHNWDEAVLTLLRVLYPGFEGIRPPFICSAARISRQGRVYVDMVNRDGERVERVVIFQTENELQSAFRRLADELKLSDKDRLELFGAVARWIVCDYRIDPLTGRKEEKVA